LLFALFVAWRLLGQTPARGLECVATAVAPSGSQQKRQNVAIATLAQINIVTAAAWALHESCTPGNGGPYGNAGDFLTIFGRNSNGDFSGIAQLW